MTLSKALLTKRICSGIRIQSGRTVCSSLKYSAWTFRDEIHADYIRYTHNDCDTYEVMEVEEHR